MAREHQVKPIEWRRVFRNGISLGLVFAGHLMLLLCLIAYRAERIESNAVTEDKSSSVLHASLDLRRDLPVPPPSMHIAAPLPVKRMSRHAPAVHVNREDAPVLSAETDLPGEHEMEADARSGTSTGSQPYGDPDITHALSSDSTKHAATLPGYANGSKVRGVDLAPPSSIRKSIERIGDFLTCSQIQMKRQTAGYGLDRRLAQAYEAMGCTL